ncbi:uncharacterized protein LOC130943995 [Arachis stenosperma]|uniref:uncharacterized protein LOC130943995 n=1 Tax=Arachis stenosperma TaxID=217475 RepID=UPI0025AD8850|nr:uncharacterized protein LOC130943995 [Arachis stenosperma]
MTKFKNSQVIVLFILLLLLVITPLLPSSLRPTYMYFISNFLIIALGAEAGLLTIILRPLNERKHVNFIAQKPLIIVEKLEKFVCVAKVEEKARNCASMPSIFFIGGDDGDEDYEYDYDDDDLKAEDEIGGVDNGQELFAKAEAFIGNFYKQLKMQREESWIHHKAY